MTAVPVVAEFVITKGHSAPIAGIMLDKLSILGKLCGNKGIMVMMYDVIEYVYQKSCQ